MSKARMTVIEAGVTGRVRLGEPVVAGDLLTPRGSTYWYIADDTDTSEVAYLIAGKEARDGDVIPAYDAAVLRSEDYGQEFEPGDLITWTRADGWVAHPGITHDVLGFVVKVARTQAPGQADVYTTDLYVRILPPGVSVATGQY